VPFTREAVEQLSSIRSEPDWLRARRLFAFDIYERSALPDTKRDQDWRQVDLKGLDLQAFAPYQQPDGTAVARAIPDTAAVLAQRGTGPAAASPGRAELDRLGVVFCPLWQAAATHPDLVQRYLFTGVRPERDKFAALHGAFFSGGTFLYVPDGVTVDQPLISQFWSAGTGGTALPHSLIVAGKGASFQYLDEFLSPAQDPPSLTSGSSEIFLDEGAVVTYVALHRWGKEAWQFANQRIRLGRDAHFKGVNVSLGGRFARLRMEALFEGQGSSAELRGLFFGTDQQAFDFRTLQDHLAPNTTSDLLYKGALRDQARSVYVGVVRVEKNARGTSANQANRNLLLSEKARATSEPILEIENNDILRCSHGATVGPVDPEHLFYLTSRGIPGSVAERMLVQGFLSEVLDRIPVKHAREVVEDELARRID
jgi:Fe-S cluster assembly protein SufD